MRNMADQVPSIAPDTASILALVLLALPFCSFLLLYFFGRILPRKGDITACVLTGISFVLSLSLFLKVFSENTEHLCRFLWFAIESPAGNQYFTLSFLLGPVSAMMLVIVNLISLLVHLYSLEYMEGKRNYLRYFPYLALFTFSMIGV